MSIGRNCRKAEQGNILFLILLVVILFAALSYAVTQSIRGGGKDASPEEASAFASQMIQNVGLIESTMMRAMLVNNIQDYGFDVSGSQSAVAANTTCTATVCRIYTSRGGGVPDLSIPDWASTTSNANFRKAQFQMAKILNIGSSKDELTVKYNYLTQSMCEAINRLLGITDIDIASTAEIWGGYYPYTGTLTSIPDNQGIVLGNELPALANKKAFCFQHVSEGYTFVYAVIER